ASSLLRHRRYAAAHREHLTVPSENAAMELSPREKDKLLLSVAAMVAERHKAKGIRQNYPEAVAHSYSAILEGARGGRPGAGLMALATTILRREDVMPGIAEMIPEVQVEATFPDGTKLVTVHNPIV